MILLDLTITNSNLIFISFLIGSPILTSITSIAASMNLLNNKSFALGSLIIMFLSIPIIIFSVGLINAPTDNVNNIINILIGILLIFLAITPWISAACIKLAIKNKELESTNKNDIDVENIRKNIDLHFPEVDTFEIYSGVMANKKEQIDTLFAIAVKYSGDLKETEKQKLNEKLKKQVEIQLESQNIDKNKAIKVYNY